MSNKKIGDNKKILMILGQDFLIPKIDPRVYKEAITLVNHGFRVTVCCLSDTSFKNEIYNKIQVIRIKDRACLASHKNKSILTILPKLIFGTLANINNIIKISGKNDFDVIHCHDADTILFGTLIKLKKFGKVKLIYDSHEIATEMASFRHFRSIIYLTEIICSQWVDAFITISDPVLICLQKKYPAFRKNFIIIKNVPENIGNLRIKKVGKKIKFLYQGVIKKGRIEIIEKIAKVLANFDKMWQLTILTNKKDIPNNSPLQDPKIIIKEMIHDRNKFHNALTKFDVGIIAMENNCLNNYYSLPNKLFDYMASGIAILAPDFPNIHHFIRQTHTGYLFTEKNIKKTIELIFDNIPELEINKANGPKAIKEKYNWNLEEKKLLSFYQLIFRD